MPKTVPFRDLLRLLEDKGFKLTVVRGSHRLFVHEASGAEVILPFRNPPARAVPVYARLIRVTLDQKGLMEPEEFDEWLGAQTHASTLAATSNGRH